MASISGTVWERFDRLVGDFSSVSLRDVTLVGNDWGGAELLIMHARDDRVGRRVLVACQAFNNYPPGVPGRW